MFKSTYAIAGAMLALSLAACNSNSNSPFRKPLSAAPTGAAHNPSPVGVTASAVAPAPAAESKSPYVLSATSHGPMIDFNIFNMGTTDLQVDAKDFAVISMNNRNVTPYDTSNAVIDLPQPAVVKPNQTLTGRAIFNNITAPAGYRLVFKPDAQGTFADIHPAQAKQ